MSGATGVVPRSPTMPHIASTPRIPRRVKLPATHAVAKSHTVSQKNADRHVADRLMINMGAPDSSPAKRRAVRGKFSCNEDESLDAALPSAMAATPLFSVLRPVQTPRDDHRLGLHARKMRPARVLQGCIRNQKTFPGQPCGTGRGDRAIAR